jgi:hypothetical protein
MTEPVIPTHGHSIHPGLRFPFEWIPPCHLGPSPVTGNEFVPADAMSSHPYPWEMTSEVEKSAFG